MVPTRMMNHYFTMFRFLFAYILLWVVSSPAIALTSRYSQRSVSIVQDQPQKKSEIITLFKEIERTISSGDGKALSDHLAKQVYVNLHGNENGYFSANQAFLILQNHFNVRKVLNFSFDKIHDPEHASSSEQFTFSYDISGVPYASGKGTYLVRGKRENFQVYIALGKVGAEWMITQINVY